MKTSAEIREALTHKYNGELQKIDGFDYIPWNDAVRAADKIFDPDGYDVEILKTWMEAIPNAEGNNSYGYAALVRVTIKPSDGDGFFRDGLGFSEVVFTKSGRALMDSAIKGCVSRSLVRALVLLGEAFGLFLYDKEDTQAATGAVFNSTGNTQQSSGRALSEGQISHLKKNFGPLGLSVEGLDFNTGKGLLDAIWNKNPDQKLSPEAAMKKFGLTPVKKGDGLPLPV